MAEWFSWENMFPIFIILFIITYLIDKWCGDGGRDE